MAKLWDALKEKDLLPPQAFQIRGINDRGPVKDQGQRVHWFELYGSFPPGVGAERVYRSKVICEFSEVPSEITFQAAGQINLWIAAKSGERWCTFKLLRGTAHISPIFGPRQVKSP